jgi:predicted nucleic acid-binding Zn ribbon protein
MAKAIRSVVEQVIKDLQLGRTLQQYKVLEEWGTYVGGRIAQVTTAERVIDGKLIVKVKSSAWRNELTFMKRDIIAQINGKFNDEIINDIIFK